MAPVDGGVSTWFGTNAAEPAWSTSKILVLAALLDAAQPQGLTVQERILAHAAITESDNASIQDLFDDLERQLNVGLDGASAYMDTLLRRSGDPITTVATLPPPPGAVTTFGQTPWSPTRSVEFFSALGRQCLLPRPATDYVLGLMQHIEPSESWGLGQAGFTVPVAFKGGWGPELSGSYVVRQSGIVDVGSPRAVAVSIIALPPGTGVGSFDTGVNMVTQTAAWLRQELILAPHPGLACPAQR